MSAATRVWATPGAFHWNSMSRMFLDVINFEVPIHRALTGYLTYLHASFTQGLEAHLNDFGRFALAAHVCDNRPIRFEEAVKIRLPNALPGTNLAILPASSQDTIVVDWKWLDRSMLGVIDELKNSNSQTTSRLSISDGPSESSVVVIQKLPVWEGPCGPIAIDSYEPCLNIPSVEVYRRIKELTRCHHFLETIKHALARLTAYKESLVKEMTLITASVTPMDADVGDTAMFSGTSSAIFGACFLSAAREPLFVAEMLLHEFCHNKLRLLQEVAPLISDKYSNQAIFYSPWRDDPRPIDGLMHGLYVFSSIAHFWLHVCGNQNANADERAMAQRRVGTLLLQLKLAYAEFTEHAELTRAGTVFLGIISDRIYDLESQTKEWKFKQMRPFFSGILKDTTLREMPILESVARHKANWEASYGD
ncbi:MAG TPA: HEXXH motif-containing putative peptide modification protein [Pyrinomonadaceae bacterium]|nr:HEXXH motif-containing putative peptide modification protein [Pyrinomonadaceae bacterium]